MTLWLLLNRLEPDKTPCILAFSEALLHDLHHWPPFPTSRSCCAHD